VERRRKRLLWASTSTRIPSIATLYIEELIGPDTVNTIRPTMGRSDHGAARRKLDADLLAPNDPLPNMEKDGISMQKVTDQLLDEAIKLFADAFAKLIAAVEQKKRNQ
jgi:transaldolase/glucose-6-phosphate isomerase